MVWRPNLVVGSEDLCQRRGACTDSEGSFQAGKCFSVYVVVVWSERAVAGLVRWSDDGAEAWEFKVPDV